MPLVSADIPKSLRIALDQEIARLRTDESAVAAMVTAAPAADFVGRRRKAEGRYDERHTLRPRREGSWCRVPSMAVGVRHAASDDRRCARLGKAGTRAHMPETLSWPRQSALAPRTPRSRDRCQR